MTTRDTIDQIAAGLNIEPEKLAADIHALCTWIQAQGNRGYSETQLKDAGLEINFLAADKALWDGMLFHAVPEKRKDYSGWGVKRLPMIRGEIFAWEETWLMRFGWLQNDLVSQVNARIDAAQNPSIQEGDWVDYQGRVLKVSMIRSDSQFVLEDIYSASALFAHRAELAKVDALRRKQDFFSGGAFSQYSTFDIAYRAACADVLRGWYGHQYGFMRGNFNQSKEAMHVWGEQYSILSNELKYRVHAPAPEKESKKKTKEAAEDWAKAAEYLEKGTLYFFSREFLRVVTASPEYPDLTIEPEHLPKLPPEKTPVAWKSDRDLLAEVITWLNAELDPFSFEFEDRKTFIDMARRWLAASRGEKMHE